MCIAHQHLKAYSRPFALETERIWVSQNSRFHWDTWMLLPCTVQPCCLYCLPCVQRRSSDSRGLGYSCFTAARLKRCIKQRKSTRCKSQATLSALPGLHTPLGPVVAQDCVTAVAAAAAAYVWVRFFDWMASQNLLGQVIGRASPAVDR